MKATNLSERKEFYKFSNPEIKERTQNRLNEIQSLGMEELGYAHFGVKGVVSGLYLEMVWNYTDEEFKDYINFVKDTILDNELRKS
jgi:hypothetical protein